MANITAKQKKFVAEYLLDLNATQAAIRSGYSRKTAQEQSSRLLSNVMVQQALSKAKSERLERTNIDSDYVLKRLVAIDEMDILDIVDDSGNVLPITQWPKVWRTTVSGIDANEIKQGDIETVLRKIKWPDKVKNLELIGKHIDVQAWREQQSLKATHEIVERKTLEDFYKDVSEAESES